MFACLGIMIIQEIVDLLASTVFASLCICTYLFCFSNYIALPIFSTSMFMLCLFFPLPQLYCVIFIDPWYIQFSLDLELNCLQRQYLLIKKREIKVNLLSEYNSADIRLLFRNIIVYIILCENTGQRVNNNNLGNNGLIRKLIAIHKINILKHMFFIYLVKHIIHVCITTNITAHNVPTMGVVNCTHFSELLKINVTCTTPSKHLCSDILFLVRKIIVSVERKYGGFSKQLKNIMFHGVVCVAVLSCHPSTLLLPFLLSRYFSRVVPLLNSGLVLRIVINQIEKLYQCICTRFCILVYKKGNFDIIILFKIE